MSLYHPLSLGKLTSDRARLPDFLTERNYRSPLDKDDSLFQSAFETNWFGYFHQKGHESKAEAFHNHMRFKTIGLKWYEMPNIMENVFGQYQASKDDILLVDVGGGSGHDLVGFRTAHLHMPGRLILQDLPSAIDVAKATGDLDRNNIEALEHDFFTPQDVHGARAYFIKAVFHDWPDEQCREILENLKPALVKGHSRILLNEIIIPETGASWFETSMDLTMMACVSAQERREKHWRSLIESVGGLQVSNIWCVDGAVEKVIEVEWM